MFRKFQQRNFVETTSADNGQQIPPASTDNAPADPPAPPPTGDEKRFTQAELEAQIKDRLERERKKTKEDAEKAAADAETKRLQDEQKFKELSEKQATDLLTLTTDKETLTTQLTTLEGKVKSYEDLFAKQLAEQKKALPEPVTKLLDMMPLLEQMAWLNDNAAKLGITLKGVPATPKGSGGGNNKDEEAARASSERTYSRF
jgi:hypothetical protein